MRPTPLLLSGLALLAGALPALAQEKSAVSAPPPVSPAAVVPAPASTAEFDAGRLWDGRKIAPFRALDNPKMVPASESGDFLDDDEYILGVSVGGQYRAYPTRFVWFHHAVNDSVMDKAGKAFPFAVTYCSVCNTGIAYNLTLDGVPRKLEFFGLYNGIVALEDRDTESVFLQAGGKFTQGPLKGKTLADVPLLDTTWGQWKALHPDTLVMSPDNAFSKFYKPKGSANAEPRGYDSFPLPFFAPSLPPVKDERLPRFEKVYGVQVTPAGASAPAYRAYPIAALKASTGVLTDTVSSASVAILFDPQATAAVAVTPVLDGKPVTLEVRPDTDGKPAFYDKETGSRWTLEGEAVEGPLKGKHLPVLSAHLSQWYGWTATHPETTIYGKESLK